MMHKCDNEQGVFLSPLAHQTTNTTSSAQPACASKPATSQASAQFEQAIASMIQTSSQNKQLKRIGNHALLTDRMLGKGHYGKVYLGYELLPQN